MRQELQKFIDEAVKLSAVDPDDRVEVPLELVPYPSNMDTSNHIKFFMQYNSPMEMMELMIAFTHNGRKGFVSTMLDIHNQYLYDALTVGTPCNEDLFSGFQHDIDKLIESLEVEG